jgi:hypothetical protein
MTDNKCRWCGQHYCVYCNRFADNLPPDHLLPVGYKIWVILTGLQNKYQDVLRMPEWTEVELSTLSPELRKTVESGIAQKEELLSKIDRLRHKADAVYQGAQGKTAGQRGPDKHIRKKPTQKG